MIDMKEWKDEWKKEGLWRIRREDEKIEKYVEINVEVRKEGNENESGMGKIIYGYVKDCDDNSKIFIKMGEKWDERKD